MKGHKDKNINLNKTYFLGIDIGRSGAVSLMSHIPTEDNEVGRIDLKWVKSFKNLSNDSLCNLLKTCKVNYPFIKAYIEEQQSVYGNGVKSAFSLGVTYGTMLGLLTAIEIEYELIHPNTWQPMLKNVEIKDEFKDLVKQKNYKGNKTKGKATPTKAKSLSLISELLPKASIHTSRGTPLDGNSDAICIAIYGKLKALGRDKEEVYSAEYFS